MSRRVLITGGAGFIGSHVADELLSRGYVVRVLDALLPQLHGPERRRPAYLDTNIELVPGDIRDQDVVRRALEDVDVVFHLAARIGVGQIMYEVAEYTSVNNHGTAVLLEAPIARSVERLVVASSMTLYGESRYRDPEERIYDHVQRTPEQIAADLAAHGRATILDRHTCGHRADELLAILAQLGRRTSWSKDLVA